MTGVTGRPPRHPRERTASHPETFRALGVLCEPPDPAHRTVAASLDLADWPAPDDETGLFTVLLLPYAALYVGPEGMLGGVAADRIAGFWHALGYDVPAEPDHLAGLLGLYAALVEAEQDETDAARALLRRRARAALLWEHLMTWVPAYASAVAATGQKHHGDWAALLTETLLSEAAALDAPATPPAHLHAIGELPAPEEGADAFVRALLTPVRSGIVLTRSDLVRCARGLGLGMRIGERAFVLRQLLESDAVAVLGFIADEADRWARQHSRLLGPIAPLAQHWVSRAEATAEAARHRSSRLQEVLVNVR